MIKNLLVNCMYMKYAYSYTVDNVVDHVCAMSLNYHLVAREFQNCIIIINQ